MDYQSFKDYVVTFLWKAGDAQLIDSLDNLIEQAEAMLNRDVRDEYRHQSATILVTQPDMFLPSDYNTIRQVVDADTTLGEYHYVTPAEIAEMRTRAPDTWQPFYSMLGDNIMFAGPASPVTPKQVTVYYHAKIAGFKDTDQSWFRDKNPDIFLNAVLMQTAPFLREDTRVPVWQAAYNSGILMLNDQSAHEKQRGVYASMPLPRRASGIRPKGRSSKRRSHLYSR